MGGGIAGLLLVIDSWLFLNFTSYLFKVDQDVSNEVNIFISVRDFELFGWPYTAIQTMGIPLQMAITDIHSMFEIL